MCSSDLKIPVWTGQQSLVGKQGVATTDFSPSGEARVESELWSAEKVDRTETISKGERIEVVSIEGLRLIVKKIG